MRKFTLILLPILFIFSVACTIYYLFVDYSLFVSLVANIFWVGFMVFALWRMFNQGSFRKTNWIRGAYFGIAITIAGSTLKIQHWPGANLLISAGCFVVALFYTLHFIKKPTKALFDWLKVFYVILTAVILPIRIGHYAGVLALTWAQAIVAVALITIFYIREWKGTETNFLELSKEDQNVFRYGD